MLAHIRTHIHTHTLRIYLTVLFCRGSPSVLWHCWLGDRKGIWSVRKTGCWLVDGDILIGFLQCTSYSSSCHHSPPPSPFAPIKPGMETFWYQVHLENDRQNGERECQELVPPVPMSEFWRTWKHWWWSWKKQSRERSTFWGLFMVLLVGSDECSSCESSTACNANVSTEASERSHDGATATSGRWLHRWIWHRSRIWNWISTNSWLPTAITRIPSWYVCLLPYSVDVILSG